jgi:hypothetical protein
MDLREMSPGTTVWLPVQVSGGLLSVGDLHAAMGTAEPTWVSLEAAGQATLKISLEKGMTLNFPRLRIGNLTLCIGMSDSLERAHQAALDQAYDLLVNERGLEPFEACALPALCRYAAGRRADGADVVRIRVRTSSDWCERVKRRFALRPTRTSLPAYALRHQLTMAACPG